MNIAEMLMDLADCAGVSGDETCASEKAMEYLSKYSGNFRIKNGNVIADFGEREEGKSHILIDAHIDQIGFIINYITDEGFIKVSACGGIDCRLLLAQQITILGKKPVSGIVCTFPPHLSKNNPNKVPDIDDIYIDVGMTKEEADKVISLGDRVVFAVKSKKLTGDRITGAALDDRCGVVAILYAVKMLKDTKLNCSYSVMFSTQEEVGERGAKIGAFEINPDIALEVDVSFALTSDDSEIKCGHMGKGCMIGIAPALDRDLSNKLISLAEKNNIPYQIEVMNGTTGTNADQFSVTRCGAKAATLSVPIKYMHTPVEVVSLSDIINTSKIIVEFLKEVC